MRTAEETAIELYRIANDVNVEYAQNTFQHMDVDEKKPWLRLAEYGMNKYDEAVAHGMTISAGIALHWNGAVSIDDIILTARDNKVWRKE